MIAKISVIIPVYNVEAYIEDCLNSVISQSLKELEIIIVDDGSNDKSGKIIDEYAQKDKRIRAFHIPNSGVSNARNYGLRFSTCEYVYIMDSDDILAENALEYLYNSAVNEGADVVLGNYAAFYDGEEKRVERKFFNNEFVTDNQGIINEIQNGVLYGRYCSLCSKEKQFIGYGAPWTKLIARKLIIDNNLKFDSYVKGIFDDNLFSLHVFEHAKKVLYINQKIYYYRIRNSSLIHRFNPDRLNIHKRIFEKVEKFAVDYHKDESYWKAYYARIIGLIVSAYRTYFSNNACSNKENYNEFVKMLKENPYCAAVRKTDFSKLSKAHKVVVIMVRMHMEKILWLLLKWS